MEVRPGYQQTDVGVIPDDWRVKAVGQISTVGRGRVISHKEIARALDSRYPVYSSQTSNNGVMGYLDTFEFEGEYITWTTDGANAGTVFYRNGRFNCTNVCGTIKLKSDNHLFVAEVLGKFAPRHVSRHLGNPKLMNDVMKRVKIPIPSTKIEQHIIANALSDADALIKILEQLLVKKLHLKQGAMQELLTGRKRLPGFELKPGFKQTEMGLIPKDWELKKISDLKPFVTSGSRGWAAFYSEFGSPFIRITNLSRSCIYLDLDDLRFVKLAKNENEGTRTQLQDGDVLISITADIGIIGYVTEQLPKPTYINQHIALVRFDQSRTSSKFISYFLATEKPQRFFRALTDAGAKAGMNLTTVQQIRLTLPPTKAEQEAIAEALSDMDSEVAMMEARLAKARQLKQGMMQELLTGRTRLV